MQQLVFPPPAIPINPILSEFRKSRRPANDLHSVLDRLYKQHVTSGRSAIALCLEHAGVTRKDQVLLPAYHCEAMVAPVKWIGAKPVFYRINRDTSFDFEDIVKRFNENIKAIIVTHFFGFTQSLERVRTFCDEQKIVLIEDCAHAFFGAGGDHPIGSVGDYSIASSMKIFPIYEGGLIASDRHDVTKISLKQPPTVFQIKSLINALERAISYKRLGYFGAALRAAFKVKDILWTFAKRMRRAESNTRIGPGSSEGGYEIDGNWVHTAISPWSNFVIRRSDLAGIAESRRKNYQKLHAGLADLPRSKPLFDRLPDNCVPWVYPLYVEDLPKVFNALKLKAVPIWRFGEILDADVTEERCPVSVDFSNSLLQFPCHQSLNDQEIEWMINEIQQTFKTTL